MNIKMTNLNKIIIFSFLLLSFGAIKTEAVSYYNYEVDPNWGHGSYNQKYCYPYMDGYFGCDSSDYSGGYTYNPNPNSNNNQNSYVAYGGQMPYYQYTENPVDYSYYQVNNKPTQTVSDNKNNETKVNTNTTKKSNEAPTRKNLEEDNGELSSNSLTALSFRGSGGFMPSSIWQWLLVIVLIFTIILLARKVGKKDQASHESHH